MIKLLNIDCMEYMADLEDNAFDLAICDPPYGIGEDGRNNHTRGNLALASDYRAYSRYDQYKPDEAYFNELFRVSKNQIIWGANHFGDMPGSAGWVIWDKENGATDFADCELAYTSFDRAARKYTFRWSGMLQGDMKTKEIRIHPNQKPAKLYQWLLKNYAKPGQRILDTHLGSGSSAIAAHYFGVDFVGCEIDEDYYAAAKERFDRETRQVAMF